MKMKKIFVCALAVFMVLALASCRIIDTIRNLGNDTGSDTVPQSGTQENGSGTVATSKQDETSEPAGSETETETDAETVSVPYVVGVTDVDPDTFASANDMFVMGLRLRSADANFDDAASELLPIQVFKAVSPEVRHDEPLHEMIDDYHERWVTVYSCDEIDKVTDIRFCAKYDFTELDYSAKNDFGEDYSIKYDNGSVVETDEITGHGGILIGWKCVSLQRTDYSDGFSFYEAQVVLYREWGAPSEDEKNSPDYLYDEMNETWLHHYDGYDMTFFTWDDDSAESGGKVCVISFHPELVPGSNAEGGKG